MRGDLEFVSIPRLVRVAAERYAEHEAVVEGRTRITFRQLGERVERAAAGCVAAGVEPGDRVAVWAPNTLDWIVSALGAVTAGAVLVPVNTRFKGAETVRLLERTRARMLFVTGTFLGTSYVAALRNAAQGAGGPRAGTRRGDGPPATGAGPASASGRLPGPGPASAFGPPAGGGTEPASAALVAGAGPLAGLPHLRDVVVLADDAPADFRTWKEFLAAGDAVSGREVRARADAVGPGEPSDLLFTSGTTGEPKGAVITHAQTLRAFGVWSELAGLREGDRYLIVNPFFHTFGYKAGVIACLMRGATMVPQPVFTPEAVLAHVVAERISVLPGPPTLHQALLDHSGRAAYDLSSLRVVVTGAAVVPPRLVERLRSELGVATVLTAYGMSEASGLVTMCRRGDPPELVAGTSGRAVPDTEVKVVGADRVALPPGAPGEILVRGYQVMSGYFEDPEATKRAVDADGWLHTGDVGVLDADGNLRVTDRVKDMFVVGGFNAYPAEIERVLARHPGIAEVAVVGVADARLGEVGKAFAVRRGAVTAEELIAWARREMANYKVPREVEFVPELPRNASGKVLKRLLRERAASPAGGRRSDGHGQKRRS
ncbi:fatty acid--CoA ligase [Streptomyces cinnamoneus]|uniref:Fatty acid--CoA ligase n=1 Tax=Streptomyces cinnamoneus TaxID=53446 RepID=A0A2G1XIS1_STRCJ|nr:AMP-binding protein [Streptomyces cinnamoneus]PHQ51123.1 fatty acid--CoA ligase [Streptomyces cinnamoneus]PPT13655.1 fatty acid--CoA ligase [Streptomyces cinnamoneus]